MPRTQVIIEVTPTRLELAVVRAGKVVATRCERVFVNEPQDSWTELLNFRQPTLNKWVAELGVLGAHAVVLYSAATQACGVFACPASAGTAGTERAAMLAVSELASLTPDSAPTDTVRLWADSTPTARPGQTGPGDKQVHTLAAVDRENSTLALARWVTSAGLKADQLLPADAPAMARCVQAVTSKKNTLSAVLWVGEHQTILAVGSHERLRFVRAINIGAESLVEALCRPMRSRNPETPTVTLDRASARALLHSSGIPSPEDVFDAQRDIAGSAALPLLQPILQRFAIEIKQSMRFATSDDEREQLALQLLGPCAGLARLGPLITQNCALNVAPVLAKPEESSAVSGVISAFISSGPRELCLLPRELEEAATQSRLRVGLRMGLAASLGLVALYAGSATLTLLSENARIATLETRAREITQRTQNAAKARNAVRLANQFERRAAETLGESASWSSLMQAIAELTPAPIRLSSIDQTTPESGPECRLSGVAVASGDAEFAELVASYTRALSSIPMVRGVKLGTTSRANNQGRDGFRFELTVSLTPMPAMAIANPSDAQTSTKAASAEPKP